MMFLGIEMDFVEPPAGLFWCLELCPVVEGGGMGLFFLRKKKQSHQNMEVE